MLLEHMQKKFEINWTEIMGGCQLGRKGVMHNSKSDLPLIICEFQAIVKIRQNDHCAQPGNSFLPHSSRIAPSHVMWFRFYSRSYRVSLFIVILKHLISFFHMHSKAESFVNRACHNRA